jgi:hypothetical protein
MQLRHICEVCSREEVLTPEAPYGHPLAYPAAPVVPKTRPPAPPAPPSPP